MARRAPLYTVLYLRLATLSCRLTVGIWYSGRPLTNHRSCLPSARSAFILRLRVKVLIHCHACRAPPSHHEAHCVGRQGQVQGLFLSRCQITRYPYVLTSPDRITVPGYHLTLAALRHKLSSPFAAPLAYAIALSMLHVIGCIFLLGLHLSDFVNARAIQCM